MTATTTETVEEELDHKLRLVRGALDRAVLEIIRLREERESVEAKTVEKIAAWIELYGTEPVKARVAARAIRDRTWK